MLREVTGLPTAQRFIPATAMLVDLGPKIAAACSELLGSLGYRVVFVAHIPAACERIAVVMPLLLVADADAGERERAELRDRAVAVGAHMLWFPKDADAQFVSSAVRTTAVSALQTYSPK
jgi:hypothetical protein